MNRILYILCAAAVSVLAFSCKNSEPDIDFATDIADFTIGPEGGEKKVSVSGNPEESWYAVTEDEWLLVSPATGKGSSTCTVAVDSTVLAESRTGKIDFTIEGEVKTLTVTQDGFNKEITFELEDGGESLELPDYAAYGENNFEVDVTANVPFDVVIPEGAETWLTCRTFEQKTAKYRPRTVKVIFEYEVNTEQKEKLADIRFVPGESEKDVPEAKLSVKQAAAPKINNDRRGDSLALLAIARDLGLYGGYERSQPMDTWEGITLYTKKSIEEINKEIEKENQKLDEANKKSLVPESYAGRLRSAEFFLFNTNRSLPYEVQYLKTAESLAFISNGNNLQKEIVLGPEITELTELKSLDLTAYGITELPESMTNMKGLERLSISVNNITSIPEFIRQENFPHMRELAFVGNRRVELLDLSNTNETDIGLGGPLAEYEWLFQWENLTALVLSTNYFEGSIPDMEGKVPDYAPTDTSALKKPALVGTPKVLPNITTLSLNLNRLTGDLPEWILLHPHLTEWDPYVAVFNQEGKDSEGKLAGFDNVPNNIFE